VIRSPERASSARASVRTCRLSCLDLRDLRHLRDLRRRLVYARCPRRPSTFPSPEALYASGVADHAAIAGLMVDLSGGLLLARAFGMPPDEYAHLLRLGKTPARPAPSYLANVDPEADFAYAKNAVEARVGSVLLVVGFIGQATGAIGPHWLSAAVAYPLAIIIVLLSVLALGPLRDRRERAVFVAMMTKLSPAPDRYDLYSTYKDWFTYVNRQPLELVEWVHEAERRMHVRPLDPDMDFAPGVDKDLRSLGGRLCQLWRNIGRGLRGLGRGRCGSRGG
jgi:hypothetical protein